MLCLHNCCTFIPRNDCPEGLYCCGILTVRYASPVPLVLVLLLEVRLTTGLNGYSRLTVSLLTTIQWTSIVL